MIALPDVNVLVALAWSNHVHHHAAHLWFANEAANGWATCLLTQSGSIRLSMNPKVIGLSIGCPTAQSLLRGLVSHPNHRFLDQLPSLTDPPFDVVAAKISGYRQLPDAVLLDLANRYGVQLVTFDRAAATLSPWSQNVSVITP